MRHRPGTPTRIILSLAIGVVLVVAQHGALEAQQQDQQQQTQERVHIVKKGDTLWDLAGFYLMNPFLWPDIFEVNRDVVEDPHWIYPDERLVIPPLVADQAQVPEQEAPPARPEEPPVTVTTGPQARTRFYAGSTQPVEDRGPRFIAGQALVYPAVTAREYRAAPWVQDADDLTISGRLYGLTDPATAHEQLSVTLRVEDRVYISDIADNTPSVGDTLMAIRVGEAVDGLGEVISPLALIRIDTIASEAAVGTVVHQYAPTWAGDQLIPLEPIPNIALGSALPVSSGANGSIVGMFGDQAIYLTSDRAFLDIGQADGLGVGDELVAYYPERHNEAGGPLLPNEVVATMRVVKVRENTATVRVLEVNTSALETGLPVRVVRQLR